MIILVNLKRSFVSNNKKKEIEYFAQTKDTIFRIIFHNFDGVYIFGETYDILLMPLTIYTSTYNLRVF